MDLSRVKATVKKPSRSVVFRTQVPRRSGTASILGAEARDSLGTSGEEHVSGGGLRCLTLREDGSSSGCCEGGGGDSGD